MPLSSTCKELVSEAVTQLRHLGGKPSCCSREDKVVPQTKSKALEISSLKSKASVLLLWNHRAMFCTYRKLS